MGALMRARDWASSPLGAPADWPATLKGAIATCLSSQFPMVIWWGPQLLMFYNDAWQPILGETKHPSGLGRPGSESWPETWPVVGAQFENALKGVASWSEDLLLASDRRGFLEECYFTYSHSPLKEASARVVGVCTVVNETTPRVLGTRRLHVLLELARATAEAANDPELPQVCEKLLGPLCAANLDLPFAALYLADADGSVHLGASAGIDDRLVPAALSVETADRWGIGEALRKGAPAAIEASSWEVALPGGAWPEPATQIISMPLLHSNRRPNPCGVLVVGISPRLRLDPPYLDFLRLVAAQLASALSTFHLRENERMARAALEESARSKDEFLALLAHELRNPLAPILTSVAILKMAEAPETARVRSREVIDRQVGHMARLLDDLLDVSRLSRGQLTLQRTHVRLGDVLAAAIELSQPLVEQRGQVLEWEPVDGSIELEADPARLTQVFGNLLNNAARFSPRGSTIGLSARRAGDEVLAAVHDAGVGIAPDRLESIFGLFSQGSGTADAGQGGLGIGLTVAKTLVELHGGHITAESGGPGQGSTFTVRLPSGVVAKETPPVPDAVGANGLLAARVVVADDNVDAADSLSLLLTQLGCEVRTVYGGEPAVEAARVFAPDIVFLDLGMSGLDGCGACRRIRQEPWGGGMTLVAVTGWGRVADRRQTEAAGFDHHLVKPVKAERLRQLVFSRASSSAGNR
jgi:signal transduction histidine kinase